MNLVHSFQKLKSYCELENFEGWDPYDGLNSKVFQTLPFIKHSALCRLVMIQGFKRCPLNLRRILMVPKGHNAKGLALFLSGYCNLYHAVKENTSLEQKLGGLQDLENHINSNPLAEKHILIQKIIIKYLIKIYLK